MRRVALTLALVLPLSLGLAPGASAEPSTTTLTVLGTSDVFDSNLVQSVIKPGFEAANPGVTLDYKSSGTGQALDNARKGLGSATIVHAAALENQFVAEGYSLEPYGRAVFWGDFVLAGPANDPAGVLNGSTHDITTAFEKIATAGTAGRANFVSRGGTPGTTIAEHAIWALTSGVATCNVPDGTRGGGRTPTDDPTAVNQPCPTTVDPPSWYQSTGLTQGPNVQNANVCNYSGGGCYVFTDRGTLNYLQAQNLVPNLRELVRGNDAGARGGQDVLINSFHAYAVNPAKVPASSNLNPELAKRFLDYLTSDTGQAAIGAYLKADPPFLPSARPQVTRTALPGSALKGTALSVTGTLKNAVPGTPALSGVPVFLFAKPAGASGPTSLAAQTTTDATGAYRLAFAPAASSDYTVVTNAITKIEVPTLNPPFGDILQATSTPLGTVRVTLTRQQLKQILLRKPRLRTRTGRISLHGEVPSSASTTKIKVYLDRLGDRRKARKVKTLRLAPNATTWSTAIKPARARYSVYVKYVAPGSRGRSKQKTVRP